MGKYTLKLEEVIDKNDKSDPNLEFWEKDGESKYWIHRTMLFDALYFNPNFKINGCPMILTEEEIMKYVNAGKKIVDCISVTLFYNDEEEKNKVLSKLKESGLTQDDFEDHLIDKISPFFKSFFEKGIYMADVYGGELNRTANQFSPEKMRRIIYRDNFGFNCNRGDWNVAFILEIPLEEQDKALESLPEPIKYGTEYYQETKISQVISPKYIKGMIVKFGKELMFIKNDEFEKKIEDNHEKSNSTEKEMYLYHTEQLFNLALQKYMESLLPAHKKAEEYVESISFIEEQFRKYARETVGFVGSKRYKQVYFFLKNAKIFKKFEPDMTKGNYINKVNSQAYYTEIAKILDSYSIESSFDDSDELKLL